MNMEVNMKLLLQILQKAPEYIFWKDANFVYRGCNENFAELVGALSPEEVIDKKDIEMPWGGYTDSIYSEEDRTILKTGKHISHKEVPMKCGVNSQVRYLSVSKVPLYNDQKRVIGILGIFIDVTDRKKYEEDLHYAKEQAEASSKAKSEFITNMSHDIRTPLTGIIGMSKILEDNTADLHNKQYAQWLRDSGNQLLNMLNGVLDSISSEHVTDADLHNIPFNIQELVLELVQLERPSTILKNIDLVSTLDDSIPACLFGDCTKLHRILLNLLGNAIKFTQEGHVALDVSLRQINATHAVIQFSITDTGMGIPDELIDKVFDRFFKVTPSYKGLYSGHGLGLHIAQTYAKQLGGTIQFTTKLGAGTRFYFTLSFQIGNSALLPSTILPSGPLTEVICSTRSGGSDTYSGKATTVAITPNTPHILLVEDNKIALIMLENLIGQAGCRFTSVMDGETALDLAKKESFNLIITDIGLPGLSGIDLTYQLRLFENDSNKKPVLVIGLTGHTEEKINQACLQAGISQVFTKPLTPDNLATIKSTYLASVISP